MNMNKLLGKRLRELRNERSLTQDQIAQNLNISRQRYARIENGLSDVTLEVLSRVAELFNIKVYDITKVLDDEPETNYRLGDGNNAGLGEIQEMLNLFYANKHAYERSRFYEAKEEMMD